jgi:multimeric flavodoxin WrbA
MSRIEVRKGMPDVQLTRNEFERRFRDRFFDPAFAKNEAALKAIIDTAWDGYDVYRKNPVKRVAGEGYAKPEAELPVEWLATKAAIDAAEARQKNPMSPSRILLVNGSMRSDQSCPGEMSKTWRLLKLAEEVVRAATEFETEILDLSLLTSQYGRVIHPCKACVSTAMPLCHWPCSCYPNFAMGQTSDWMNEIYPMWAAAHGVMIVTPVHWYQAPTVLKAMMDRLVCADGGNPDPTATSGKDPQKAKDIELKGWDYPRHLAGRAYAVVVHGDAAGSENLRRALSDWLADMGLLSAGHRATIDRYVGYYESYAESHLALDADRDFQEETRNAARALVEAVKLLRRGAFPQPDEGLVDPRPK